MQDLAKVQRIADPQLSPDGKWIAYEVGVVDLACQQDRPAHLDGFRRGRRAPAIDARRRVRHASTLVP